MTPFDRPLAQRVRQAKVADIKKIVTPNLSRHNCTTQLLQNRANLHHVQEMLGHKRLATTDRYLRVTIADPKDVRRRYRQMGVKRALPKSPLPPCSIP